jgi:hypothetical protein
MPVVTVAVLLLAAISCTPTIERDAHYAAKGAVSGTYDGIASLPKNNLLAAIAKDPDLREAAHDLAQSIVLGAGDGAAQARIASRVELLVTTLLVTARTQGNEALGQIITEQGPKLGSVVRRTLADSLQEVDSGLRSKVTPDLVDATQTLVTRAVESFGAAVGGVSGAGDALGSTSAKISAGAVRGFRTEIEKPETADALAALSRRVASEAAGGIYDGLKDKLEPSKSSTAWMISAIVGLTLLVICGAALALLFRRHVLTQRTLALLASQINAANHTELKRKIQAKAVTSNLQPFLSGFLIDRGL